MGNVFDIFDVFCILDLVINPLTSLSLCRRVTQKKRTVIFWMDYLGDFGNVFDILDFVFFCTYQFELVPTGDTEEEDSGQYKQLQSNCLDAVKFAQLKY